MRAAACAATARAGKGAAMVLDLAGDRDADSFIAQGICIQQERQPWLLAFIVGK